MNNEHQENGALTGPLIFTLPASSFIVVLSLNWLDGTVQLFPRKTPRLELSGNSEENDEGLRGRGLERNAGSCKTLPKRYSKSTSS
jgi:hypothetical protein